MLPAFEHNNHSWVQPMFEREQEGGEKDQWDRWPEL